jgi:cytochrome c-type biogenesis protein CcmH/NrfG
MAGCAAQGEKINYSLDDQLKQADEAYSEARLDDAERIYLQIAKGHPDLSEVWFRLGNIYTREGQFDAAVRAYSTTLRLDSSDGRAWYNLSLVHTKRAVATLEDAIRTLPPDSPYRARITALHDALLDRVNTRPEEPR